MRSLLKQEWYAITYLKLHQQLSSISNRIESMKEYMSRLPLTLIQQEAFDLLPISAMPFPCACNNVFQ